MLHALAVALLIGIGDSVNPSTVGPALYLSTGARARHNITGFLVGLLAVNLAAGLLIMLGPGQLLLSIVPKPKPTAKHVTEVVAGVILLGLAAVLWFRRRTLRRHKLPTPAGSQGSSVALGAGIGAVELPTALPYFAAIAVIVDSGAGIPGQTLMLVLYNIVFLAPILAILITLVVLGQKADRPLGRVNEWLQRTWPVLLAGLGSIVGAAVLVLGLSGLLAG